MTSLLFIYVPCFKHRNIKNNSISGVKQPCTMYTDMSKKSNDRLHDPALQVTTWDHATYPSTFLTSVCGPTCSSIIEVEKELVNVLSLCTFVGASSNFLFSRPLGGSTWAITFYRYFKGILDIESLKYRRSL